MPGTPSVAGKPLAERTALVAGDGGDDAPALDALVARALQAGGADVLAARWAGGDRWRPGLDETPQDPDALVDHAAGRLGGVDVLVVLGAGRRVASGAGSVRPVEGASVRGAGLMCAAFVRHLVPGRPGRIVLVSPRGPDGATGPAAAEPAGAGALDALARSLAPAVAVLGITVNAVDPADRPAGWLGDYLRRRLAAALPSGALDGPDDVARVVALLASDEGEGLTGQIVRGALEE